MVVLLCLLCTLGVILYSRHRTKTVLLRMQAMLDSAIAGTFVDMQYDEALLSSIETRLAQFLSLCDASSKNLAEEKAKIATLISDISHQIKTPTANILLYAELLSEQELPEESHQSLTALSAQAQKLRFLIDALVKSSRLENGLITLHPKCTDVQTLIQNAAVQVFPLAQAKQQQFILCDTHVTACFDLKWTTEALFNILENAVKYTPEHGQIQIRVTPYTVFCRIDVEDTGIGIAESDHAEIFTRFYRAADVQQQKGVGIGLYLAREILIGEEGYIRVSSKPGEGSVFSLFLPMGF